MTDYLPDVYVQFRERHPDVASALDRIGEATATGGPLDDRTQCLVKIGIAIGASAEGAVRSNVRKALAAGATADEITHVGLVAITTAGFPAAIAGMQWAHTVLEAE